jgi:hypothetical protein
MISRDVVAMLCFAWLLSFPTWELMWMGKPATYTDLRTVADR